MTYYVYILVSRRFGTLYIGITNDLRRRLEQHRSGAVPHSPESMACTGSSMSSMLTIPSQPFGERSKLKKWNRDWKMRLIEEHNPEWRDLAELIA